MKFNLSLLVFLSIVALNWARPIKDSLIQHGCPKGMVKQGKKANCICKFNKWICSYGIGRPCKYGHRREKDGSLMREGNFNCLCSETQWYCEKTLPKSIGKRSTLKLKSHHKIGCQEARYDMKGGLKCVCRAGVWRCTDGDGKSCKVGHAQIADAAFDLDRHAGLLCFCSNGKPLCQVANSRNPGPPGPPTGARGQNFQGPLPPASLRSARVKRQRDTCTVGPYRVPHGKVYEFGINCDCVNGSFKCSKYSRFRNSRVKREAPREADLSSSRLKRKTAKSTGDPCTFVKAKARISRQNGERFAYGMRCECTDGKTACTKKRV